jgi:hypothetical protein
MSDSFSSDADESSNESIEQSSVPEVSTMTKRQDKNQRKNSKKRKYSRKKKRAEAQIRTRQQSQPFDDVTVMAVSFCFFSICSWLACLLGLCEHG